MVAMVKHVITGCCVKGKYETNKHTNKRTNKQIKKHMFIKHGFSKTNMFLPWHVPVHCATKMGKTLKNWSIQKNVAHLNWTNHTYENLSWVHAIISFWPATTKHQNLKQQLIDDQTVLVDRDISTSQDPWAKKQENIKRWSGKNKTCTSFVSFRFPKRSCHTESANFQELVRTWKFLACVETSGACQAAHSNHIQ